MEPPDLLPVPLFVRISAREPKKLYPPLGPIHTPKSDPSLFTRELDVVSPFGNLELNSQNPVVFRVVPERTESTTDVSL